MSASGNRVFRAESIGARDEQQDAALVLSSAVHGCALLVVSDGVGGNRGGRSASQKVVELAERAWKETAGAFPSPGAELLRLCRTAHDQIQREGAKHGLNPRATIVAVYLTPTHVYWVHSGDSRLYHFRQGRFLTRTEDHSLLQVMVKQGMVREKDMGRHPDQGTLLQSLGGDEYKEPAMGSADITAQDAFLLCTDGFWERTSVEEMAALLSCPRSQAPRLLQAAVDRAVKRNGPKGDNVTVAIAFPAEDAVPEAPLSTPGSEMTPRGTAHRAAVFGWIVLAMLVIAVVIFWMSRARH